MKDNNVNIKSICETIRELADMLYDYKYQYNLYQITDDAIAIIDAVADAIETKEHHTYTVKI